MYRAPDWLSRENTLAHLIGGGTTAVVLVFHVVVPLLQTMGVLTWPMLVRELLAQLLAGVTLVALLTVAAGVAAWCSLRLGPR